MLNFRCVAQCRFLSNYPLPEPILAFEKAPKLVNDSPPLLGSASYKALMFHSEKFSDLAPVTS
jgi:hypothetical protein